MTPNIFAAYFADDRADQTRPNWQPVDTTTVRLESGEVLMLQRYAAGFEIAVGLSVKVVAQAAYHAPTNTIYYYAPEAGK